MAFNIPLNTAPRAQLLTQYDRRIEPLRCVWLFTQLPWRRVLCNGAAVADGAMLIHVGAYASGLHYCCAARPSCGVQVCTKEPSDNRLVYVLPQLITLMSLMRRTREQKTTQFSSGSTSQPLGPGRCICAQHGINSASGSSAAKQQASIATLHLQLYACTSTARMSLPMGCTCLTRLPCQANRKLSMNRGQRKCWRFSQIQQLYCM
jgi:hypothetical protein